MPKTIRQIRIVGKTAFVPLTQGYDAIIDAADVPLVECRNWFASVKRRRDGTIWTVYAVTRLPREGGRYQKTMLMHRVICETPDGMQADHINGNGLDNRQANLRTATASQNQHNRRISYNNSSGLKGVSRHKASGKWIVQIAVNGRGRYLGLFTDLPAAAAAYAAASADLHGDFGRTE